MLKIDDIRLNQPVVTPLGEGVFQGAFALLKPGTEEVEETVALVRVKLSPEMETHLKDPNCKTPHAMISGLWLFQEGELS